MDFRFLLELFHFSTSVPHFQTLLSFPFLHFIFTFLVFGKLNCHRRGTSNSLQDSKPGGIT